MRSRTIIAALAILAAAPAGAAAAQPAEDPIAVSYTDLPPALNLAAYARVDVPLEPAAATAAGVPQAAVLPDGGVILVEDTTATAYLVGRNGRWSSVPLEVVPRFIVATPGPVVYGLAESTAAGGLEFVAIALLGDNAGRVVARRPVADPARYLELPVGVFGNASAGVVDRIRDPGAVMIGHVDVAGNPVRYRFPPLWQLGGDDVVRAGSQAWRLAIERHPDWLPPLEGDAPAAPTAGGGGVFWTTLGPAPPDPGTPTMPVIAALAAGGAGSWHSVPSGWQAVSSDAGGTVFARRSGDTVELARLDEALANPRPCADYADNVDYPLRLCDSGEAVRIAQTALRTVVPDLPVDGFFGPRTEAATRRYQELVGLAADGLIGPRTWPELTRPFASGVDRDGNGVVDPWEADQQGPPLTAPGFPPTGGPCGGTNPAVVLAASVDPADPALLAAQVAAQRVGYFAPPRRIEGAAAAVGAPADALTVTVVFLRQPDAAAAQAAFAERGVSAAPASVLTDCVDE
jgi:peptidoglycan hydrolase-like protein with peptidoglycan-binding domain